MQESDLSVAQKSLVFFSFLFSGLAALTIEFSAIQYRLIFEGIGAKLPWFAAFNLEWHFIFAIIASSPPLLVYLIFKYNYHYRQKLGLVMFITTLTSLVFLVLYWYASMSLVMTNCFSII